MQYISASTRTVDPYRAGSEIGERLGAISPEVAVLFTTVHYLDRIGEVLAGVRDVLGDGVLVCGGTSDGIYETSQVAHQGVCAFGIASEGRLRWSAALARGVGADSVLAAEEAAQHAQEGLGMSASLGFVLADGVRADGSQVVEGVRRSLAAPFFGGLAADDRRFLRSAVFLGEEAVQDAVMVLTAGGDIPFRIHTASGWKPMGDAGQVTDAEGTRLKMIDGRPANEFIREQIGKNCSESDLGLMPLAEYRSSDDGDFVLRTPSAADPITGELTLFGRIEGGSVVRVCHASLEDILSGVEDALAGVRDSEFEPRGVLVVSCAGRKWLLPESGREEVERLLRKLGNLPMVGIPSFGEIGPFRLDRGDYSPVYSTMSPSWCALWGRDLMTSLKLISLTTPPPEGFALDSHPSPNVLRRHPFCLYADDIGLAEECTAAVRNNATGILASRSRTLTWEVAGPYLYRLGVPEEQIPWLVAWAAPFLELLERSRQSDDRAEARTFEAARAVEDRLRLIQEHAEFRVDILRQVSERKRAEQALREGEQKYRVLAESASDIIWSVDLHLNFTYVSPSAERIQQWSAEEWKSLHVKDIVPPESWELLNKVLAEELALEAVPGADPNRSRILELQEYRKDGSTFWAELRARFLRDELDRPIGIMGVTRDISERKQAEEERKSLQTQLIQSQKIESVGRLAGGVAHDFNNMLTPILGYAELLSRQLATDDPNRTLVEPILLAAQRCRDLVWQLLAFARKQTLEMKPLDLSKVIGKFERMLRRTLREDVLIELPSPPSTGLVLGDTGQIEQVILNLALNAQDAMPRGGTLRIEIEDVFLDADFWAEGEIKPGPYVLVKMSDAGEGMDRETQEMVFEPFFTTKGPGKGTGLGLSTAYGIVTQHGGHIRVFSEPGKGTTFRLYFPHNAEMNLPETAIKDNGGPEGGTETVLVVEDQEQVRDLAVQVLRHYGYNVIEARDGPSALQVVESHEGPIHLLVTDVVLPNMNGRDLQERLLTKRSGMKVLYMSGYPADVIGHHGVLEAGLNFIQKPFSLRDFANKVREVLNGG